MERINIIFQRIFLISILLIFIPLIILNGYTAAVCFVLFFCFLVNKKQIKHFAVVSFVVGFALRCFIILLIDIPIESDFEVLFQAAQSLLNGDLSFAESRYFYLWGYQSGFVAWEAFWLKIWNSAIFLRIINALLVSGTITLLYCMIRNFVSIKYAQMAIIVLHIMPFMLTYHTVLTNQIPSLFFNILALWFIIEKNNKNSNYLKYIAAGICLQIGNILRPESIIFIVALMAYLIFEIFQTPSQFKKYIINGIILCISYVVLGILADWTIKTSGLSLVGLKNMFPGWKFVCGLNKTSSGQYSAELWQMFKNTFKDGIYITKETTILQNSIIKNSLSNPIELMVLFVKKIYYLYTGDILVWSLGGAVPDKLYRIVADFQSGVFYIGLSLSFVGLFSLQKDKKLTPAKMLFWFVPFTFTSVMLLIEIQARYIYIALPLLMVSSAFGLENIFNNRKNVYKQK